MIATKLCSILVSHNVRLCHTIEFKLFSNSTSFVLLHLTLAFPLHLFIFILTYRFLSFCEVNESLPAVRNNKKTHKDRKLNVIIVSIKARSVALFR